MKCDECHNEIEFPRELAEEIALELDRRLLLNTSGDGPLIGASLRIVVEAILGAV